jgi:hypothetical protein
MRTIVVLALALSACATQSPAPEPAPAPPASARTTVAPDNTRVAAASAAPKPIEPVTCLSESQRAEYERRSSELFKSSFRSVNPVPPASPASGASTADCVASKPGDLHNVGGCLAEAAIDSKMGASSASSQAAKSIMRNTIAQMRDYHYGLQKLRAEYPSCGAAAEKSTR